MSGVEPTKIDFQGLKMISEDETQSISLKMDGTSKGMIMDYDLTSVPKQFKITPSGINWTDGTSNHTTGLERLALVQTAFQAVELPPNATTLKLNDTILLDDGTTTTTTITNNQTQIIDTIVGTSINQIVEEVNGSGSSVLLGSSNLATASAHLLRLETTLNGDAVIQHQEVGTSNTRNLGISSTGNITLAGDNIDLDTTGRLYLPSPASSNFLSYLPSVSNLGIRQTTTGGVANPIISLNQNDTASGACNMTFYKNTFVNGSTIGEMSFRAKTAITGNPEREYARIGGTIRSNTSGNVDGAINFQARINDTLTECMRINGQDSQIEIYQPLDLNDKDIVSSIGDIELNATASAGTGDILLNPKVATGYIKPSKEILTDSKIANLTGFQPVGPNCEIDFANATPDYRFTINPNIIELTYYNTITTANQQIYQDYISEQAFFRQQFTDNVGNVNETLIRNDVNSHSIKLSETASGGNTEITKDEIDIDSGSGQVVKLTPTDIQFDIGNGFTSIRPQYFNSNGGQSFSVSGSPSGAILSAGTIVGAKPSQRWKIEIGFTANSYVSDAVITYRIVDSVGTDVAINASCAFNSNSAYPVPIQVPTLPAGAFISISDNFLISGSAVGTIQLEITGGTFNGGIWSGTYSATATLTYIDS